MKPLRAKYILAAATMGAGLLWATLSTAAPPQQLVTPHEEYVTVEVSKGTMLRLDQPVSSVVVADPDTADIQVVSPKILFVRGKKVGETSIYAIDNHETMVLSAIVNVTHNISHLNRLVKRVAPDADVDFNTVNGGLVMEGFTSSAAESENIKSVASAFLGDKEKVVDMMKSAGSDQVSLQVRVVEMERNDLKHFGVNMQNAFSAGGLDLQILQGPDISIDRDRLLGPTNAWEVDRLGLHDRLGGTSTQIMGRWNNGRMTNIIDALETQGLAKILAEPNLTTTSGKTANFLAGGEFPITVAAGNGTYSVQYKPFGVSLNFTPVVMDKNRISMMVAPEVSTISFDNPVAQNGINNPIILTRKAQATVELGSGQTFALAGLLKNETSTTIEKFPGLGDVPVLGSLFRSNQFQNNMTELVILVTPYIVRPISERAKVQTPSDGYVPPSDLQLLLLGNLYQQEPMNKEEDMPTLHGEGGFMLE